MGHTVKFIFLVRKIEVKPGYNKHTLHMIINAVAYCEVSLSTVDVMFVSSVKKNLGRFISQLILIPHLTAAYTQT